MFQTRIFNVQFDGFNGGTLWGALIITRLKRVRLYSLGLPVFWYSTRGMIQEHQRRVWTCYLWSKNWPNAKHCNIIYFPETQQMCLHLYNDQALAGLLRYRSSSRSLAWTFTRCLSAKAGVSGMAAGSKNVENQSRAVSLWIFCWTVSATWLVIAKRTLQLAKQKIQGDTSKLAMAYRSVRWYASRVTSDRNLYKYKNRYIYIYIYLFIYIYIYMQPWQEVSSDPAPKQPTECAGHGQAVVAGMETHPLHT